MKLRFSPRRITDPDFGNLLFMFTPNAPGRSYWECEWRFPKTGTLVAIELPGGESGPAPESREFYLGLPGRFEWILTTTRPMLKNVFEHWLHRDMPQNIFTVVKLAGFGLEDARKQPVHWDVSFETTGQQPGLGPRDPKWLGITVSFVGDTAQEALVDT